jgi:hypothetical protein
MADWEAQAEGQVFDRRVSTATEERRKREPESLETTIHFKACSS